MYARSYRKQYISARQDRGRQAVLSNQTAVAAASLSAGWLALQALIERSHLLWNCTRAVLFISNYTAISRVP